MPNRVGENSKKPLVGAFRNLLNYLILNFVTLELSRNTTKGWLLSKSMRFRFIFEAIKPENLHKGIPARNILSLEECKHFKCETVDDGTFIFEIALKMIFFRALRKFLQFALIRKGSTVRFVFKS